MQKRRDPLFDVLKGVAILLVVAGHIAYFCIGGISESVVFQMIGHIHMPLFFFVSGWFAYKHDDVGKIRQVKIWPKFRQLMIPMIVVSSLFLLYYQRNPVFDMLGEAQLSSLWLDRGKYGYWFPLTLFEIFVLYYVAVGVINRLKSNRARVFVILSMYFILVVIAYLTGCYIICDILQLSNLADFFPCFIIGAVCRKYNHVFYRLCADSRFMTFVLLVVVFPFYCLCWPDDIYGHMRLVNTLCTPIVHTCLAFIAFAVFKPWTDAESISGKQSVPIRFWAYLGRNSFGIYLLHYFFLFPLSQVPAYLTAPFLSCLIICVLAALSVTVLTCGLIKMLSYSRTFTEILTGSR